MYVIAAEKKDYETIELEKKKSKCVCYLLVASCLLTILAVGVTSFLLFSDVLKDDDSEIEPDRRSVDVDFSQTEFNLFEYYAICEEAPLDDTNFLRSCFGGHNVECTNFFDARFVIGFHCPTLFNGECVCGQGSINLVEVDLLNPGLSFGCELDVEGENEVIVRNTTFSENEEVDDFDEVIFEQCPQVQNEFNPQTLLDNSTFLDTLNNVDVSLAAFNALITECITGDFKPETVMLIDNDTSGIFGCLDANLELACFDFGFFLLPTTCEGGIGVPRPVEGEEAIKRQSLTAWNALRNLKDTGRI